MPIARQGMRIMPYTVPFSFDQFRNEDVDLDSNDVTAARVSRDALLGEISKLPKEDVLFPRLYGSYQYFGSFARRTKVRPLDDIDILILFNGKGTTAVAQGENTYWLKLNDEASTLNLYTDDWGYVNSTKLLNKLKISVRKVYNYSRSDIKRTGEAVVLNLTSYPWAFDLVPAFSVGRDGQTSYYLIPDGKGEWQRTDPRVDQASISETNKRHNGIFIPLVRLLKYWNTKRFAPRMGSYHLEVMMINSYRYKEPIVQLRQEVSSAFLSLSISIMRSCEDPKGFGANLDTDMSTTDREKIKEAAMEMFSRAYSAVRYEEEGNSQKAISEWRRVFPDFPKYGSD